jgi:nucleoside transporter
MMFVQYFALGAWIVPLAKYLGRPPETGGMGFSPPEVSGTYTTFALGGLIAPLFTGLLADRFFAAEKLLGVLHALMAGLLLAAGWWADAHAGPRADPAAAFGPLYALMLGYNVCCLATLTLTNVIGFRTLADPRAAFGYVRLVGTFGWIVAGFVVGFALDPVSAEPLYLGAGASALMAGAVLAGAVPHTPPKGVGRPIAEVVGLPAVTLLRDPVFVVFALVAFLCNALNQFYTVYANPYLDDRGVPRLEAVLTIAQWVEMACMAATPALIRWWGLKPVMAVGLAGFVVRNGLLASGSVPLALAVGVPMHGLAYAFFGMLGAIFVDREAPPHLRAGAQALVMLLTNGPALLVGNLVCGRIVQANKTAAGVDWPAVWVVSFVGYAVAAVAFVLFFREPRVNARP